MAADAMISEGGALRQPSQQECQAVLSHVRSQPLRLSMLANAIPNPGLAFCAGVATGLLIAMLSHQRSVTQHSPR